MTPPILVTGASSFVGIHTIIQLLEQGYSVRGTIRSLSKETEVHEAVARFVQANDRLEFKAVDLEQDTGWDEAMHGVESILHVASPFPLYEPKHEDELIIPAVQGTLRVRLRREKRIPYDLSFVGNDARAYRLRGQREPHPLRPLEVVTDLRFSLYDSDDREIGRGLSRCDLRADVKRTLASVRLRLGA